MVQWSHVVCAIGALMAIFGAILGFGVFPALVGKKVEEGLIIVEGTDQYERFVTLPQPLLFKVYIFNITNPEEVQEGALPIVKEVGPYIYKQYRKKKIKDFSRDKTTVTFTQQQTFEFDYMASAPLTQSDKVMTLNMHMNAFLQVFEQEIKDILRNFVNRFNKTLDRTPVVRILKRILERIRGKRKSILQAIENDPGLSLLMTHINANLNGVFNNPTSMFMSTTVREYLFEGIRFCVKPTGLARAICKQIREKGSKTIRTMDDGSLAFSFFNHKNRTNDGVFEVHTGLGNSQKLLEIEKWEDSETLQIWLNSTDGETSICNLINGTDAASFPPFRKRGDSMYIFSSDICRSVQLFYEHDIKYKGIPGFRYTTGDNFLNSIGPEYSNGCFCVDRLVNVIKKKNGCLLSGAMDLTPCIDAPVILTLPHMLGAAKEYTRLVRGQTPNLQKHQTYVDIQHITGTPLQGGKRVQFNMFLKHINKITLTENLTTSLVPAIWVEEGIALNQEMVNLIKGQLMDTLKILDIVFWTLIVVGLLVMTVSFLWYFLTIKDPVVPIK